MTDMEKYINLLTIWGVEFTVHENEVALIAKSEKVQGYSGFECTAKFDSKGDFLHFGIWE